MKEITLANSVLKAKVDDQDYELINAHVWYYCEDTGYAFRICRDSGIEYMHDMVMRLMARWN